MSDERLPSDSSDESANGSAERILRAATSLFADYGFHGVSTRSIASAVDLNVATVSYHVGNKEDLYLAVFRRVFLQEFELVSRFVENVADDVVRDRDALRDLLTGLVDALVDMTIEHPDTPRLWVRRWLEDPGEGDDIDNTFSLPLYRMVWRLLDRARQAGTIRPEAPDLGLFLISFTWILYGYFAGRPLARDAARADPYDPERLAGFRVFLHDYLCRMLDL